MGDEEAERDIDNELPPIPSLKQLIVAYKPVKYHFQEHENASSCY